MTDLIALVLVVIINLILGLLVLSRNFKNRVNILYSILTLMLIVWSVANYSTNHVNAYSLQLITNRAAFLAAFLLVGVVWLFSLYFPRKIENVRWQPFVAALLGLILVPASLFSPYIISSVNYSQERQVTDITPGSLYPIFLAGMFIFFIFLIKNFRSAYISNRSDARSRQQILYTAVGILFTFLWILITGAVWPLLTGDWVVSKISILGSIFLGSLIGFAIIRHKLFDIRLIVARSVAYALTLSTIAAIYTLFVFTLSSQFLGTGDLTLSQQAFYLIAALFLAFTLQPLKKFFDKTTNRIFYRDAYEPQVLLDELNKVLVSNIELEKLLSKSAEVIGNTIKSEFCLFGIKEINNSPTRILGLNKKSFKSDDVKFVRSMTPLITDKIIVTDELDDEHLKLKNILAANDISLLICLTDTPRSGNEGLGYIIIGPKKSGNTYATQDTKILEIIADEMIIAIQNALRFEEIQNFAKTLEHKVEEATKDLRNANEKLKQLDQTKDDFISMASHQLRTPLTSVKGYVSMVLEGDAGKVSSKQKDLLNQAFVSSQRMVYLIADLLNVSRLRTGKFVIEAKPTNLADVVEGEIQQLIETAKGRNLEMTYQKPKNFPTLMLDDTKIRQVIMNFADNAIYYTPSGGHIKVELEDIGETVEFRVVDDGLGVPKSEQHHLFNKFYRASNAKKARPDGTGLGLFMAKKVIVAQGGAIIFNTQEGKGSTFGFSFEKAKLSPEHYKGAVAKEPPKA